jgi:hypothetical protein
VYLPALNGRQGELTALADIQSVTRRTVLPLIEIVPGPVDYAATLRTTVDKTVRKLRGWREAGF